MTDLHADLFASIPEAPMPAGDRSPEALKQRLGALIRHAARQGAASVAHEVVRCFQALYLHADRRLTEHERAAYCRGARHWQHLARLSAATTH